MRALTAEQVFYCKRQKGGRYLIGSYVNGADLPMFRNVSREDARRTGQMLLEMGEVLGPEFEINCTTRRRKAA